MVNCLLTFLQPALKKFDARDRELAQSLDELEPLRSQTRVPRRNYM